MSTTDGLDIERQRLISVLHERRTQVGRNWQTRYTISDASIASVAAFAVAAQEMLAVIAEAINAFASFADGLRFHYCIAGSPEFERRYARQRARKQRRVRQRR